MIAYCLFTDIKILDKAFHHLFLQALVPVTIEVEVPFELHRYIIGQKGSGIRKMMDEFEVRAGNFNQI